MELYLVVVSVGAAIVAGTWRLAAILNKVLNTLHDIERRLSRLERLQGVRDDDDLPRLRVTSLAEEL